MKSVHNEVIKAIDVIKLDDTVDFIFKDYMNRIKVEKILFCKSPRKRSNSAMRISDIIRKREQYSMG